jgi:hypothetical protein
VVIDATRMKRRTGDSMAFSLTLSDHTFGFDFGSFGPGNSSSCDVRLEMIQRAMEGFWKDSKNLLASSL